MVNNEPSLLSLMRVHRDSQMAPGGRLQILLVKTRPSAGNQKACTSPKWWPWRKKAVLFSPLLAFFQCLERKYKRERRCVNVTVGAHGPIHQVKLQLNTFSFYSLPQRCWVSMLLQSFQTPETVGNAAGTILVHRMYRRGYAQVFLRRTTGEEKKRNWNTVIG